MLIYFGLFLLISFLSWENLRGMQKINKRMVLTQVKDIPDEFGTMAIEKIIQEVKSKRFHYSVSQKNEIQNLISYCKALYVDVKKVNFFLQPFHKLTPDKIIDMARKAQITDTVITRYRAGGIPLESSEKALAGSVSSSEYSNFVQITGKIIIGSAYVGAGLGIIGTIAVGCWVLSKIVEKLRGLYVNKEENNQSKKNKEFMEYEKIFHTITI